MASTPRLAINMSTPAPRPSFEDDFNKRLALVVCAPSSSGKGLR